MSDGAAPIGILTVCSHNRTRSVMIAAMLQSALDDRLDHGRALVTSAGFGPSDVPAIPDAVAAMRARGLDVADHTSRPVTPAAVDAAALILTAERDHVVKIAMMSRAAFGRAMTLPEFLERAERSAPPADGGFADWVMGLTADRTTEAYLRKPVEEIPDPTGSAPRAFEAAVDRMREQCAVVADLVAAHRRQ